MTALNHFSISGRPDQVNNCTLANVSMTSFTIQCAEGFNGGLQQSFLLEVRELHTQILRFNSSAPHAHFHVGGLEHGSQFHAFVYSYNGKGRSQPFVMLASTIRLPEKQLTAEKGKIFKIHVSGTVREPDKSKKTRIFHVRYQYESTIY